MPRPCVHQAAASLPQSGDASVNEGPSRTGGMGQFVRRDTASATARDNRYWFKDIHISPRSSNTDNCCTIASALATPNRRKRSRAADNPLTPDSAASAMRHHGTSTPLPPSAGRPTCICVNYPTTGHFLHSGRRQTRGVTCWGRHASRERQVFPRWPSTMMPSVLMVSQAVPVKSCSPCSTVDAS